MRTVIRRIKDFVSEPSVFIPFFLCSTFAISMASAVFSAWIGIFALAAYLLMGFIFGCWFVSAYSKALLGSIEQRPEMYGSLREVESMYIFMLMFAINIRPARICGIKKKLIWSDWFNFVFDEMGVSKHRAKPFEFKKYEDLINMFIKFRESHDVRLFYKKSDDVVI